MVTHSSVWELLDSTGAILNTASNITEFSSARYALPVGTYQVRITCTILGTYFNLTTVAPTNVSVYVIVNHGILATGVQGPAYVSVPYNATVYITAANLTYDLDVPSLLDWSGMTFQWRCRRSNETWPAVLPSQPYEPSNDTGCGCFGRVGPGIVSFAAGIANFSFPASYLDPLVNYSMEITVTKNVRTATGAVNVYIQPTFAPVITLGYCSKRMSLNCVVNMLCSH